RNRLLRAIAAHWKKSPPQTPVIAAGTTGSIPATAELLHTIIGLPQGRVILPGLDQDMDAASWHALDESHPQYLLKNLLHRFEQEREQIPLWPTTQNDTAKPRRLLATEIMRPPATTDQWAKTLPGDKLAQQNIKAALGNLHLLHCTNEREEATAIAILLRQSLAIPDQKAVLITPRRSLAHRVIAACRRWNITLDDSAGRALDQTEAGIFLRLSAEAIARDFSPVALLALLKHPRSKFKEQARALDLEIRGTRPAPEKLYEKITDKITPDLDPLMRRITNESRHTNLFKFNELLVMHLDLCERLSPTPDALWQNEDGEAAALFLTELKEYAPLLPEITKTEYCGILDTLLITIPVRSAFGGHPRLKILGQLEARMTDADLVIMAGLNEKTWPPDPGFDPWMSRPMRKEFGLPAAERSIGLAAHDFIQGFCAPNTVITRSERQDGAPTVPARWLQRLTAVLEAAGIDKNTILSSPAIHWANALDETTPAPPLRRPEPRPPLNARPQKISVTQVEKWQKDPYSIYA
ncbi:MAG: double-strand break repair protein AddB, partial [Alphaproteobacteria bacterium]